MPQSRIKFHIKDKGVLKKDQELFKKEQELFQKQQDVFDAFLLVLHNMAKYLVFLSEVSASPQTSCSSALPLPRIRKLSFRGSFLFHAHFLRGKGLKTPYFIPGRNCL